MPLPPFAMPREILIAPEVMDFGLGDGVSRKPLTMPNYVRALNFVHYCTYVVSYLPDYIKTD